MITMILSITMIYLLEKIFPISKSVKWIENGTVAYYNANTAVEQALLFMNSSLPWTETWVTKPANYQTWYNMQIIAAGKTLPLAWEWNSDFDKDWNRIGPWEPVQLVFNNWVDWTQVNFYFRVPDIHQWTSVSLSWWINYPVINWMLSWSWRTLFASWSQIMANSSEIFPSTTNWVINLSTRLWLDLEWSWWTLSQFYNSNSPFDASTWLWTSWVNCTGYKCTLKLSIVNPLTASDNNEIIPYLEYKIDIWANVSLPLQYAIIKTDGFSYWFKKSIRREVRQTTINEAMDFTVFQ